MKPTKNVPKGASRPSVGVGYTGSSLRFSTFIFFSFTFDIVITKMKKFYKNIDSKKNPLGFFFESIFLKNFSVFVITI